MYCLGWKAVLFLLVFTDFYNTWAEDDSIEIQGDGRPRERILNGKPVNPPHSRPYIVQLVRKDGSVSVAVIYDKWTIVALGWKIKKLVKIFAGKFFDHNTYEDSQQERIPCMVSRHPKLDSTDQSFNYGIIHLREPLIFNENVQPAKFPVFGSGSGYPTTNCKIAGWGRVKEGEKPEYSEVLRETSVNVLPAKECQRQHFTIQCISKGACHFDWGAPVTCRGNGDQDIVMGQVIAVFIHCGPSSINLLAHLPQPWFDEEVKNATKHCRAIPTTTPKPPPPPPPPPPPTPPPPPPPQPPPPPPPTPPTSPPPDDCCNNGATTNGNPAIPHSRPFIVQIHMKSSKQVAIGVLINAYTIVTSARQIDDVRKISAGKHLFGKYEGTQQTRTPCSISKHPNIGEPENAFDYGLIHLADPFVFNEYVNAISLAPSGDKPKEECSIIAWQQNLLDTELREQNVSFKDPSMCKIVHDTITCVEGGACLHDWGSPVICSHDAKIFFHAIVSSAKAYCEDAMLASIAELPRNWLATELRNAETTCGKSIR